MKTEPSPFIITFSIYSMETGRHYMILQSGIFQATNSFSQRVSICSSSLAHILYSHSTLHSRTESIPPYFFTSTAFCICLTDLITCVVAYLFMEVTVFSRLSKDRDTNLTTFDSSATKYCLALGKCSGNIFWIIMNEETVVGDTNECPLQWEVSVY